MSAFVCACIFLANHLLFIQMSFLLVMSMGIIIKMHSHLLPCHIYGNPDFHMTSLHIPPSIYCQQQQRRQLELRTISKSNDKIWAGKKRSILVCKICFVCALLQVKYLKKTDNF